MVKVSTYKVENVRNYNKNGGKNMAYEASERETIINICDLDEKWNIYTRQRKVMTKLKNAGYKPFNIEMEDGTMVACEFELDFNKITFRNANTVKREMTEEQRLAAAERLRKARESK